MQSAVILRGIIDIQSEEIGRLMSLVEHLTESLEQSQSREKAALQRCKELEIHATSSSAAARRASETLLSASSAADMDAFDPPDEKELLEMQAHLLFCLLHYICSITYTCILRSESRVSGLPLFLLKSKSCESKFKRCALHSFARTIVSCFSSRHLCSVLSFNCFRCDLA